MPKQSKHAKRCEKTKRARETVPKQSKHVKRCEEKGKQTSKKATQRRGTTSRDGSKSGRKTSDAKVKAKHRKSHATQGYDKQRRRLDDMTGVNRAVRAVGPDAKER